MPTRYDAGATGGGMYEGLGRVERRAKERGMTDHSGEKAELIDMLRSH